MRIRSCILLALLLGASYRLVGSTVYTVTDLTSLGGGNTHALGINNAGSQTRRER